MKRRRLSLKLPHLKARDLAVKSLIVILVLLAIGLALVFTVRTLTSYEYFDIKDILVGEGVQDNFSYLKGRNIFSINLAKESQYIFDLYPVYKKIRLVRLLPNRLYVDFVKRQGVAYVKLYRYFCVDKNLILFDLPSNWQEEDLPIIVGLETKIHGPKSGKKYAIRELALALNIINEINNNRILRNYKLKTVDVTSPNLVSLFLQDDTEIKMGQGDIKNKINILSTLLFQAKNSLNSIKYIDLRFKDPVIKLKDTK
jgi:cell division septal protein FtsQ